MAIKPILFNTEMVRAILDGRKACTRRILKGAIPFDEKAEYWNVLKKGEWSGPICVEYFIKQGSPYQPGDILYVRETWSLRFDGEKYFYKADKNTSREEKRLLDYDDVRWHPSIHMPKEAARIWLKVTDVRVERLQDITPKDAENEGVGNLFYEDIGYGEKNYGTEVDPEYGIVKEQFAWLWESTIKKSDIDRYGWDANPWVWVIEFERCEKPKEV